MVLKKIWSDRLMTYISNYCGNPDDEEEAQSCHGGEDLKSKWLFVCRCNYQIRKGNYEHNFYFEVAWHLAVNIHTTLCGMCCFI